MNLEQEIESTGLKEVDFTCDFCEQTYYEEENVVKEEVFFGKDKVETSRGVADKIEENVMGYRKKGHRNTPHDIQVLGKKADEIQAILQAIHGCSSVEIDISRRVETWGLPENHQISFDSYEDFEGSAQVQGNNEFHEKHDDVVAAKIEVTPDREPDAIVCEHCERNIEQ